MKKKLTLQDLKNRTLKGEEISFDIVNHKNIPNSVRVGNSVIGHATISTIKAFNNWKKTFD
jgi:hypothetical protein